MSVARPTRAANISFMSCKVKFAISPKMPTVGVVK